MLGLIPRVLPKSVYLKCYDAFVKIGESNIPIYMKIFWFIDLRYWTLYGRFKATFRMSHINCSTCIYNVHALNLYYYIELGPNAKSD